MWLRRRRLRSRHDRQSDVSAVAEAADRAARSSLARRLRAQPALVYFRTMAVFAALWWAIALWDRQPGAASHAARRGPGLLALARDLELFQHAGISLARLLLSLALASALAIPLGLAMGLQPTLDRVVDPTVEMLRPISGIAWIPLALFIFGIGNALPVFIMTYAAFFPILLGTIAGVRTVDRASRGCRAHDGGAPSHDRHAAW